MNFDIEKKQIINQILSIKDEWIIKAIKKLLDLEVPEDIVYSEDHKLILNERLEEYHSNSSSAISLQEFVEELKAEGKL